MDYYFAFFDRATHTALRFQQSSKFFEVVLGSDVVGHDGHHFTFAITFIEGHAQLLLCGRQSWCRIIIIGRGVLEIGVSGVHGP